MTEAFVTDVLTMYPVIAPILFILLRSIPIIVPPIPGVLLDIVAIAIFGWLYGFILAGFGVMLGTMVSFYVARYYREPLVARFAPVKKIHGWEKQFSEQKKFWGLVGLRIVTGPFFDYISYAAGLTSMRASIFFWSTFFSALPMGFLIYYFGGLSFSQGYVGVLAYIAAVLVLGVLYKGLYGKNTKNG